MREGDGAEGWLPGDGDEPWRWLVLATYVLFLVVAIHQLASGRIDRDHGWYRAAAMSVLDGRVPYLSFPFTQAPGFLAVLTGLEALIGTRVGVRAATIGLGLAAFHLAVRLADEVQGPRAAALGGFALAANPLTVRFLTIVKPFALASALLLASALALRLLHDRARRYAIAGSLAGLAVGTRHSLLVALPALALAWHLDPEAERGDLVRAGLGAAAAIAAAFSWAFALAPEQAWFDLVAYHLLDAGPGAATGPLGARLDAMVHVVERYAVPLVAGLAGLLVLAWRGEGDRVRSWARREPVLAYLAALVVLVVASQALVRPIKPTYPALFLPLFAAIAGVAVVRAWDRTEIPLVRTLLAVALLLPPALSLAAGGPEGYRTVTAMGPEPESQEAVGAFLEAHVSEEGDVLTLHPLYAVLGDRTVVPGYEMGGFYYEREGAGDVERLHTASSVVEDVREGEAAAVVLAGSILEPPRSPPGTHEDVAEALADGYRLAHTVDTDRLHVEVYLRADESP